MIQAKSIRTLDTAARLVHDEPMHTPLHWRLPRVVTGTALLALMAGLSGCITDDVVDPDYTAFPSKETYVSVDSNPSGAVITVNGRMVGRAPLSIMMLVDDADDLVTHYSVAANFQSGGGGFIMEQYNVHDRAPRSILFTPQEVESR